MVKRAKNIAPKTVEEAMALPESSMFDEKYKYLGGDGIDGDDVCAFSVGGGAFSVECRRQTPEGPDVWVRIRL